MGESEQLEDVGYLQDIISYIFDEKKIVTYKWISSVLGIHVNRAKILLYMFIKHVSEQRLKELKITYLIGGNLSNNKGRRIQIVAEEDLDKAKAQFEEISSEHIYSVCLQSCLPDLHNLCSVDGVKDSKVEGNGAIRFSKGLPRSLEEIKLNRHGAYRSETDDKKWPTVQSKQPCPESNDRKPKMAVSISSMFSSHKAKTEDNKHSKPPDEVQSKDTTSPEKKANAKNVPKNGKQPAGRLVAMFAAQSSKPKPVKNEEKIHLETQKKIPETKSEEIKNSDEKKNSVSEDVSLKPNKSCKSKSKKSNKKKRKISDGMESNKKKRKRILIMDDSDSSADDIFGSDEEEESEVKVSLINDDEETENAEEQEEELPKQTQTSIKEEESSNHNSRKRHLVDKTFMDEEGYLVTKKVYEFVDGSENENEEKENEKSAETKLGNDTDPPAKETKDIQKPQRKNNQKIKSSPEKKKSTSPEKRKQATLMNFFKRC